MAIAIRTSVRKVLGLRDVDDTLETLIEHEVDTLLKQHGEDPAGVRAALEHRRREMAATQAEVGECHQLRRQMLLGDATDAQLDKIERRIDRATARVEILTQAEVPLRQRLAHATARAGIVARNLDRATFAAEFEPYVAQLRACMARGRELIGMAQGLKLDPMIGDTLALVGFLAGIVDERGASFTQALRILGKVIELPAPMQKAVSQPAPALPGRPIGVLPPSKAMPPPSGMTHSVSVAASSMIAPLPAPVASRAQRAPDDLREPTADEVAVVVVRQGYEGGPDNSASHVGRRLVLPRDVAVAAGKGGAVEILPDRPPITVL